MSNNIFSTESLKFFFLKFQINKYITIKRVCSGRISPDETEKRIMSFDRRRGGDEEGHRELCDTKRNTDDG